MPANYVLLERIELNASAASVTFSNIPQSGYTDLLVVMSARSTGTNGNAQGFCYLVFNGSNANFTSKRLYQDATTAGSDSAGRFVAYIPNNAATANTFGTLNLYIPNYTSSNFKSWSTEQGMENNSSTNYLQGMSAGLWSNTAAINSITIDNVIDSNGSVFAFAQYSTFSLYGLAAVGTTPAIAPKASGGNITTDGTYWYHTFLTTGTFVPQTTLTCDVLVVAGGGGGSSSAGGGGGAGGLLTFTSQSVATSSTVTVGAGGAGTNPGGFGANGNDSQFAALTLVKGGGRGGNTTPPYTGATGGSGGGGGGYSAAGAGGSATSGQGYAGGGGSSNSGAGNSGGGGGGGAGGIGTNAASLSSFSIGANGGVGFYNSLTNAMGVITGTGELSSGNYYYAGGGASGGYNSSNPNGTGGTGGGGYGAGDGAAGAGKSNTGGGGGGGFLGASSYGGAGGSGLVIVRYLRA